MAMTPRQAEAAGKTVTKKKNSTPTKTEQQLIEEMREAGKQYLKEHPEAFGGGIDPETGIRYVAGEPVSVIPEVVESPKVVEVAPTVTPTPEKDVITKMREAAYIRSLRASPDAALEVQPYTGVELPYGVKDITWQEPIFGTIAPGAPGLVDISLIKKLEEEEVKKPYVSKPVDVFYQEEANKVSNKIIEEEASKAQKEVEKSVKDIQQKIDKGEISLSRGQEALTRIIDTSTRKLKDTVASRFEKEWEASIASPTFEKKVKEIEKFRGVFTAAFDPEEIKKRNLRRLETVADIVSVVIPEATIPYFAGKGFYYAAKGQEKDVRYINVDPKTGELITPLYPTLIPSEESKKAGVSLLFAALGGLTKVGQIGKEITAQRVTELKAKEWSVTSKKITQVGDKTFMKVSASKTVPGAAAEADILMPVKILKGGRFQVLASQGKVNIRVADFMKEGVYKTPIIKESLEFTAFGRGTFAKGFFRTPAGDMFLDDIGIQVIQGEGYIQPKAFQDIKVTTAMKPSKFWSPFIKGTGRQIVKPTIQLEAKYVPPKPEFFEFGGINARGGDTAAFVSGKFSKARIYPDTGRITGLFRKEAVGEVLKREITKPPTKIVKTPGVKSSKEFLSQLYKPTVAPEVVAKEVTKPIVEVAEKLVLPGITTGTLVAPVMAPSAYAGLGLYEKTIGGVTVPTIAEDVKLSPVVSDLSFSATGLVSDELVEPKAREDIALDTFQDVTTSPISETLPVSRIKPITKPVTKVVPEVVTPTVPIVPTIPTPTITPTPPGVIKPLYFDFERKPKRSMAVEGWDAYALREATKTRKRRYEKLNEKPLTQMSALSMMARDVDNTISARGKVIKAVKKVQTVVDKAGKVITKKPAKIEVVDTRDRYWAENNYKFRPYKGTKKKKPLPTGTFIEKQKYRLDSPLEVRRVRKERVARKRRPRLF